MKNETMYCCIVDCIHNTQWKVIQIENELLEGRSMLCEQCGSVMSRLVSKQAVKTQTPETRSLTSLQMSKCNGQVTSREDSHVWHAKFI